MATKKRKRTAKVELDAKSVDRFESSLRDGLVASGAVMSADNRKTRLVSSAKVKLDPVTIARLSEVLRHGLIASHARMSYDNKKLDQMTRKVKGPKKPTKKPAKKRTTKTK